MTRVLPAQSLALNFGACTIAVETQEDAILARLRRYFRGFAEEMDGSHRPRTRICVIEEPPAEIDPEMIAWSEGSKETFRDVDHSRLIRKVRTGVSIIIQDDTWSSVWTMRGPVGRNFSQLVNLIGSAYGLEIMDRAGAMVHASAVSLGGSRAVAVMGQSGMGKSSVAVRLMEQGFDYISNDRVVLEPSLLRPSVLAHGLPKLPRVNPGTLLSGEKTRLLLDVGSRDRYEGLSREQLWQVEDKHDLEVERVLGRRWLLSGELSVALVLSWRHDGQGLHLQRLTADQALLELKLVRKTFGVFDLRLISRTESALADTVRRVPVYRVTGKADPARLAQELREGRLPELA
jgi:HprK-related kinase B